MDTIQEALQQLNMSRFSMGDDHTQEHLDRAQVLATIALAEQIEKLTQKLSDRELSNSKRLVVTVNDDTSQEQIDVLSNSIMEIAESLKIVAVIVYEQT